MGCIVNYWCGWRKSSQKTAGWRVEKKTCGERQNASLPKTEAPETTVLLNPRELMNSGHQESTTVHLPRVSAPTDINNRPYSSFPVLLIITIWTLKDVIINVCCNLLTPNMILSRGFCSWHIWPNYKKLSWGKHMHLIIILAVLPRGSQGYGMLPSFRYPRYPEQPGPFPDILVQCWGIEPHRVSAMGEAKSI